MGLYEVKLRGVYVQTETVVLRLYATSPDHALQRAFDRMGSHCWMQDDAVVEVPNV